MQIPQAKRRISPAPTPTQQRVLKHILHATQEHGRPPTYREIAKHFGWKSEAAARGHVRLLMRKGLLEKDPGVARGVRVSERVVRRDGLRGVPLVGDVPAGKPVDAIEDIEATLGIDPTLFPEANVFALRVRGESMIGASIRDGDIALVRQTPDANDGDIVVAQMDGTATLKRLIRKSNRIILHAENPGISGYRRRSGYRVFLRRRRDWHCPENGVTESTARLEEAPWVWECI